jgi:hypothetical protein
MLANYSLLASSCVDEGAQGSGTSAKFKCQRSVLLEVEYFRVLITCDLVFTKTREHKAKSKEQLKVSRSFPIITSSYTRTASAVALSLLLQKQLV